MKSDTFGLGSELMSLVSAMPDALQQADELTTLRSTLQNRASFRLVFADGSILKGRRFKTIDRARQANALAPLLQDFPFNQVLGTLGSSRLEQWIEGHPLEPDAMTDRLAKWAGDLLGRLHTLDWLGSDCPFPAPAVKWYLGRSRRNLKILVNRGAMLASTANSILDIAVSCLPANPTCGVVHTDFSRENIVINGDNQPIVVDNEHLTLGALDYDLARCWYRWPMTAPQRQAFCEAYRGYRTPRTDQLAFWGIYSLSQTARIRLKHGFDASSPSVSLERIARGEEPPIWPQFDATATGVITTPVD